jgi:hypothetical protein
MSELQITVSEIEHGIRAKNVMLNEKNVEYTTLVESRSQAKRNWKIAYVKKGLELTDVPVTVRKSHVEGDREVSKLEMQYEISLGIERACLESMKDLRSQIDAYRSFLSWKKSEFFNPTI